MKPTTKAEAEAAALKKPNAYEIVDELADLVLRTVDDHLRKAVKRESIAQLDRIFVSVSEAAALLKCSRPELYQHIKNGELIVKQMGKVTKIDLASLRTFARMLPNHPLVPSMPSPSAPDKESAQA